MIRRVNDKHMSEAHAVLSRSNLLYEAKNFSLIPYVLIFFLFDLRIFCMILLLMFDGVIGKKVA